MIMPVLIGICDDNVDDINTLSEALYEYDRSLQLSKYMDGLSLVEDCLESKKLIDILFLDIYMPGLNGIETAKKIRKVMKDIKIIFITSSKDHCHKAFEVFAFNYIVKPLDKQKLKYVMDEALEGIIKERSQQFCFSFKGKRYRILTKDILYLESRDRIIYFHMHDNATFQCYSKLDEIINLLPNDLFVRCHQSYIINIYHVTEMSIHYFKIGENVINISKIHQKKSREFYYEYLFKHMNLRGRYNET
jgi:DNA-binding LytR/AlgR family response regulator